MSTKSSLFLTNDNEHCYEECNSPIHKDGEFLGYEICVEFDDKNATIETYTGGFSIYLNDPESEIYKLIMLLKNKETEIRKTL